MNNESGTFVNVSIRDYFGDLTVSTFPELVTTSRSKNQRSTSLPPRLFPSERVPVHRVPVQRTGVQSPGRKVIPKDREV